MFLGPPHPMERWQENKRAGRIRTVIDRELNGDVIYITGRVTKYSAKEKCSEKDWKQWEKGAVKK